jgi:hypothetical protein
MEQNLQKPIIAQLLLAFTEAHNIIAVEALYRITLNTAKTENLHRISKELIFTSAKGTRSRCQPSKTYALCTSRLLRLAKVTFSKI